MNTIDKKSIAIIGGGPAGIMSAIRAAQNQNNQIYVFEKNDVLKTLLCTGGGRCNLSYAEFDNRELTNFYPRGQKFLHSIFSQFSVSDTIQFFEDIGIKTYIQEDMRIFPTSDSAAKVRDALLAQLKKQKNIKIEHAEITKIENQDSKFFIHTQKGKREFKSLIISTGGKGTGFDLAKSLGHNIIPPRPALCSLILQEKFLVPLSGISLKNIEAGIFFEDKKIFSQHGDLLFTHFGISGPLTYKISSYAAFIPYSQQKPLQIELNLTGESFEDFEKKLIQSFDENSKKDIINILSEYVPKNLANALLFHLGIGESLKVSQISKILRQKIVQEFVSFKINAISTRKDGEVVSAGGVDLNEINPKTLESKLVRGLFFCGEVLNIDGLTGGFNLQNCWSSAHVAGKNA